MPTSSSRTFSCVLMGSESLLVRCANFLDKRDHAIKAVISDNRDIIAWADDNKIPSFAPGRDLENNLKDYDFDYFFSITNLRIVPEAVLSMARKGAINFHDGPLPRYAGLNVPSWAIMNGESEHAITWHEMLAGVDEGDILEQVHFPIDEGDSVFALNTKCYEAATTSFETLLDKLESDSLSRTKQDLGARGYFARHDRPAHGGAIDWRQSAVSIRDLVRGLDYGDYDNPLGFAKAVAGQSIYYPVSAVVDGDASGAPGQILTVDESVTVACGSGALKLTKILDSSGRVVDPQTNADFKAGTSLTVLTDAELDTLDSLTKKAARNEKGWLNLFNSVEQLDFPLFSNQPSASSLSKETTSGSIPAGVNHISTLGLAAIYLSRLAGQRTFTVMISTPELDNAAAKSKHLFTSAAPLAVLINTEQQVAANIAAFEASLEKQSERGPVPCDLLLRDAGLRQDVSAATPRILFETGRIAGQTPGDFDIVFSIDDSADSFSFAFDGSRISARDVDRIGSRFEHILKQYADNPDAEAKDLQIVSDDEARKLLSELNDTAQPFEDGKTLHQLFEAQVAATPEAPALTYRGKTLSYRQVDEQANKLANYLVTKGVAPDQFVGLCTDRSHYLVIGAIGIWKAGGAYVPLDPDFPVDRLEHMVKDSGLEIIVTQKSLSSILPDTSATIVDLVSDAAAIAAQPADNPHSAATADNLAYAIYTSGSTGKPKGVLVEHKSVSNFFTGMDDVIDDAGSKRWLAVTSLSFDISVLELFWTLARGYEVVLFEGVTKNQGGSARSSNSAKMDFSLFYFSSDEGEHTSEKYRLLLEGARFADENGFFGVWTPERHFHAFGGLYPNPSVTSAALSTITKNVRLFAGSCVSPLHSPIRIAEEWSVVDNLSNGRVAIAFASGWQPNDFVLQPQNYAERKQVMFQQIEDVQKLWMGESLEMENPRGDTITVRTLPRPVQDRLPVWITTAGNPETFAMAGERGYNILTHMLGQTANEIREKIAVYREAWKKAGHSGTGHVSLMLHTFVGDDNAKVKETVREPMKQYLRSSLGLIKEAAWSFPTFRAKTTDGDGRFTMSELSDEETDAVMDLSFERYYESAGLFGTLDDCISIVDDLKGMGVDEIACLIDFGVATDLVLEQLPLLKEVMDASNPAAIESDSPDTLSGLIEHHDISHMQCTPSMARMLVADESGRKAAGRLKHLMVGGEAFPPGLAEDLQQAVGGKITNMYGPTETTIWSSTYDVTEILNPMPIGRPIANTGLYILDEHMGLLPMGVPGELYIGGDGVTRGYHDRSELTQERFVPNPFGRDGDRLYKTGDLCKYLPDGRIQFLGRNDFQVKIRGYRIELGEIESVVAKHGSVREAIVLVREDSPGDQRIVAYVVAADESSPDASVLKEHAGNSLPEYMVPSDFVILKAMPLTPNGKVDRKALPPPDRGSKSAAQDRPVTTPENDLESTITSIWQKALNLEVISVTDNFFDLGGHSLLAVQVNDKLKEELKKEISLVDLFRYPTIRSLAGYLGNGNGEQAESAKVAGTSRADERRKAMMRRRKMRSSR